MVRLCRIKEGTSLHDVAEWGNTRGTGLVLEISRNSSFALTVEGIALGFFHELQNESRIDVVCLFDIVADYKTKGLDATLGIFDGLFGLALVTAAKTVRIPSSADARREILDLLWSRVRAGRGAIGDGKRKSLTSRDPDQPVPECLRGDGHGFPRRERFGSVLFENARRLGASRPAKGRYSGSEEDAITFIFEAARNSFEHGRNDNEGNAIRGIRGILVEKLIFGSLEDVHSRRGLLETQKAYIDRVWPKLNYNKRLVAYSVVDLGPGIHHTLRYISADEGALVRLERAFRPGETRKPRGGDVEAGMGLPKLYTAAMRLHALLFVKSAELMAVADFSCERGADAPFFTSCVEDTKCGATGTSLTLILPEASESGDQG